MSPTPYMPPPPPHDGEPDRESYPPPPYPVAGDGRDAAAAAVKGPAVAMMVAASLGAFLSCVGIVLSLVLEPDAALKWLHEMNPAQPTIALPFTGAGRAIGVVEGVLFAGAYAFTIFGASRMMKLRSWGLALTAAIVTLVNCGGGYSAALGVPFGVYGGGCCCLVGLPVGIWTIVVLARPEVKAAFR